MRRTFLKASLWVLGGLFCISLFSGCEVKRGGVVIGSPSPAPPPAPKPSPPPWAPAHGHRAKHHYRYYPSHYVYYDVGRRVYFYLEGDGWQVAVQLPSRIQIGSADYVTLEMDTDRPYQYFSDHKAKYPPGQAKKRKKKKG